MRKIAFLDIARSRLQVAIEWVVQKNPPFIVSHRTFELKQRKKLK